MEIVTSRRVVTDKSGFSGATEGRLVVYQHDNSKRPEKQLMSVRMVIPNELIFCLRRVSVGKGRSLTNVRKVLQTVTRHVDDSSRIQEEMINSITHWKRDLSVFQFTHVL